MYEPFFGFNRRPFAAAPDADCYFPGTAIESARQTLYRCIDRGEGTSLLIGPSGSGKSLLMQVLAEQFRSRFEIAALGSGRLNTRRELLQAILYELKLPYRDLEEGELRLALIDHLSAKEGLDAAASVESEGLLLLIDEAHTLAFKLLEEVRLITNVIRGGQAKVRLVLAGSPALEERFTNPKLDAFNQRIAARCYLQALGRDETRQYINAQILWAGGHPNRLFTPEALDAVYQATQGVPRLVNQVCDHALLLACTSGAATLGKATVEEAWADLQQLPTPWNRDAGSPSVQRSTTSEVIEFGVLDDEPNADDEFVAGPAAEDSIDLDFSDELTVDGDSIEIDIAEEETIDDKDRERERTIDAIERAEHPAVPFQRRDAALPTQFARQDVLERLAQVEHQIASIDSDDVSDAGVLEFGPQVDLSFGASFNPFSENFAEEEVIVDPFAMTAADVFANRPLVQCEEGRKLGALLKPLPDRAAPKLSLAPPDGSSGHASEPEFAEPDDDLNFEESAAEDGNASPAIIRWPPDRCDDQGRDEQPSSSGTYVGGMDSSPLGDVAGACDDRCEPELIVIEDDPSPVHQVSVIHRQQYRQLFANLRRG